MSVAVIKSVIFFRAVAVGIPIGGAEIRLVGGLSEIAEGRDGHWHFPAIEMGWISSAQKQITGRGQKYCGLLRDRVVALPHPRESLGKGLRDDLAIRMARSLGINELIVIALVLQDDRHLLVGNDPVAVR